MKTARVNNGKIAIVGSGALALNVARALRSEGADIAVMSDISGHTPAYLGIIEATGGMAPAFDCAMTALGKGLPVISASPLLAGVHGKVLSTAARAQNVGLGLSGALLGAMPLPQSGSEMILMSDGAGAMALENLASRGMPMQSSLQDMTLRRMDTADASGKITLCRALAMHGLWSGQNWMNPGAATRVDLADLSADRAAEIRRAGYAWRFGAIIRPESVYVGPMAMGADEPLAHRAMHGLLLQTGNMTMEIAANENDRMLEGILHDARLLAQNQLAAPLQLQPKAEQEGMISDWLPLNDSVSIPALGMAAVSKLRVAA